MEHILDFDKKQLAEIPLNLEKGNYLSLLDNNISKINNIPNYISKINIGHNKIRVLENLPTGLRVLYAHSNLISNIDKLNTPNLVCLNLSDNFLTSIVNVPPNVKNLFLRKNFISLIKNLPNLDYLNLENNEIKNLENLPFTLKTLNVSKNYITHIKNLHFGLQNLYIRKNPIKVIENIPHSLNRLSIDWNNIEKVSIKLFDHHLINYILSNVQQHVRERFLKEKERLIKVRTLKFQILNKIIVTKHPIPNYYPKLLLNFNFFENEFLRNKKFLN